MSEQIKIAGSPRTYEVRQSLRELGCSWDKQNKTWLVPAYLEAKAREIIGEGMSEKSKFSRLQAAIDTCEMLEDGTYRSTTGLHKKLGITASVTGYRHVLTILDSEGIISEIGSGRAKRWTLKDGNWRDRIDHLSLSGKRRTPRDQSKEQTTSWPASQPDSPFDDEDEESEKKESTVISSDAEKQIWILSEKVRGLDSALKVLNNELSEANKKVRELEINKNTGLLTLDIRKAKKTVKKIKAIVPSCFEHVRQLAEARMNILLVGPAGCGKTYLSKLVADTLDLDFASLNCTSGMSESHLTGKATPNITTGKHLFQSTRFLDVYESGGLFLMDEIDAADPNLLLVINTALANGYCNVPHRTKNPRADRHEDFVFVATANTFGRGANRVYAGRNQLDEATLDRFRIGTVEMDFDMTVENSFDAGDDEGNDFIPNGYGADEGSVRKELISYIISLGYNTRGSLQYIRHKIEMAKTLRRLMSTRFIEQALIMRQSADWDQQTILEVFFQGWSDDELRRIRY